MKKKLTRNSFNALKEMAIVLNEQEQRAVKGGDYSSTSDVIHYTQSQYWSWVGSWPGGYVAADTDTWGVSGGTSTTTSGYSTTTSTYYPSSGDYSRERNEAWHDYIAGKIISAIPILGGGLDAYKDYYDGKINNAIGALLDKGHSGSIIVDVIHGNPSSSTDISLRFKIYDAPSTSDLSRGL